METCPKAPWSLQKSSLGAKTRLVKSLRWITKIFLWNVLRSVQLFATPWTVICQAPLFMGFFSQRNTGVGNHFLLKGIFPTVGWKSVSLASPASAGWLFTTTTTWEAHYNTHSGLLCSSLKFLTCLSSETLLYLREIQRPQNGLRGAEAAREVSVVHRNLSFLLERHLQGFHELCCRNNGKQTYREI